jgi:hypothetical protein
LLKGIEEVKLNFYKADLFELQETVSFPTLMISFKFGKVPEYLKKLKAMKERMRNIQEQMDKLKTQTKAK